MFCRKMESVGSKVTHSASGMIAIIIYKKVKENDTISTFYTEEVSTSS